jgi:hypothetical protein
MSSGYLAMEWVHGDGEEDWDPIACLEYWEVFAVAEALVPHIEEKKSHVLYWTKRDPDSRGTEVLRNAVESAESALVAFENVLLKMRKRYKENDGNAAG